MGHKFKKIKKLMNHRFDILEAQINAIKTDQSNTSLQLDAQRIDSLESDIKAIKINQSNLNRRLEAIEDRLENTIRNTVDLERQLND